MKRNADEQLTSQLTSELNTIEEENEDNLMFEDPFGDEMIEEDVIQPDEVEPMEQPEPEKAVWRPGVDPMDKDEVLDYDASAYDLYYGMGAEWPSLSFDFLADDLGDCRTRFPMSLYMVAGTQASKAADNQITVMKMSELHKTKIANEEDDEENDDDDEDGDPVLESRNISHFGGINRIRSMPQMSNVVATWADTSDVHLYDVSNQLNSLNRKPAPGMNSKQTPIQTFKGHPEEGYGMDWSPVAKGNFLTGDCKKYMYLWTPAGASAAGWAIDKVPFVGHQGSVEDLQWSPNEATVFSSCSTDQTVKIWDTRKKSGSMLSVHAHDADVNVISWNRNVSYLLVSGSDDGSFKIWDLRNFKADSPVAHFRYHTAPITSVEWHPTDESVLAVSGEDNQISVWDMSVEEDTSEEMAGSSKNADIPPQLLFIHQGQTDIKELHFHRQCPGVIASTAGDGYNVFKPANLS